MNLVILGAPGVGKGTQATLLCEKYGMEHLSTGDMLRDEIRRQTDIGRQMSAIMEKGLLVPDETVIALIEARMEKAKNGFLLDGFPRNIAQAEELRDDGVKIDAAIWIDVDADVIIARLSGRRVCRKCGATYHTENKKPQKDGVCDVCGGELAQRPDDAVATVKKRLEVFEEQTAPVVAFYEKLCGVVTVKGDGSPQDVTDRIAAALE